MLLDQVCEFCAVLAVGTVVIDLALSVLCSRDVVVPLRLGPALRVAPLAVPGLHLVVLHDVPVVPVLVPSQDVPVIHFLSEIGNPSREAHMMVLLHTEPSEHTPGDVLRVRVVFALHVLLSGRYVTVGAVG